MGLSLPRLTPAVKVLLIVNVAVFLLLGLLLRAAPGLGGWLYHNLALSVVGLASLRIWTLLTYAFVHDLQDIFHLLFNVMLVYFFGPTLEARWGTRRFVLFYLVGALGGGLAFALTHVLLGTDARLVGASGAVLALIVAWGMIYPNLSVYFFGVIPLKGKHLIWITVAIEVLVAVSQTPISSSAHFGGMAAGALMVSGYWRPQKLLAILRSQVQTRTQKKPKLTVIINPDKDDKAPPGGWIH